MTIRALTIPFPAALSLALALFGEARQRFFRSDPPQNDPPPTELILARWKFGTHATL